MTTSTTAPIDAAGTRRARSGSRGLVTVVAALVLLFAAGFVFAPSSVSAGAIQSALPFAAATRARRQMDRVFPVVRGRSYSSRPQTTKRPGPELPRSS